MRNLMPGMQTRNVRRWQRFLNCTYAAENQPYFSLPLSSYFGKATEAATRAFQRDHGLEETGTVDAATRIKAAELGFRMEFELGPERQANGQADLREFRPYFLVPLLEDDLPKHPASDTPDPALSCDEQEKTPGNNHSHFADIHRRIRTWVEATNTPETPAVTDVFVFSHGWHRNFYGAVQAYDRMASLIVRLRHRGRLNLPPNYRPLFLMLHWNSDPGENEWVDRNGRRTKASFLENVAKTFEPIPPRTDVEFINDFEDIHNLFARTSSPDVSALSDPTLQDDALLLTDYLKHYRIKAAPGADDAEKAAVAWSCYHEAAARRILLDQSPIEASFITPASAIVTFGKFVVGSLGLLTVLGAIVSGWRPIVRWIEASIEWLGRLLAAWIPGAAAVGNAIRRGAEMFWNGWNDLIRLLPLSEKWHHDLALWSSVAIALFGLSLGLLKYQAWQRASNPRLKNASGTGVPLLTALSWVYLQVVCSIIPLVTLTLTFFFGRSAAYVMRLLSGKTGARHDSSVPGLFDERFGRRDTDTVTNRTVPLARDVLGAMAAFPAILLLQAAAKDSALARIAEGIRAQVAFFQMQRKGVEAGRDAAHFLAELMAATPELTGARIHLTGHSFGGLVVANVTRYLALDERLRNQFRAHHPERNIFSLTLLQAALSSSWFHCEDKTRRFVQSTITCIYSGYDTANGFLYPAANNGRMAAGYAGLHFVGGHVSKRGNIYLLRWLIGRVYGSGIFIRSLAVPILRRLAHNTKEPWLRDLLQGKAIRFEEEGAEPEHRGRFISLSEPPDLDDARFILEQGSPAATPNQSPRLLNLDASRIIYHGAVATGGGHGDVFKESVISLIWAAITQGASQVSGSKFTEPPAIAPPENTIEDQILINPVHLTPPSEQSHQIESGEVNAEPNDLALSAFERDAIASIHRE